MRKLTRAVGIIGLGLAPVAALAWLGGAFAAPLVLYNGSPSEPEGFYRLSSAHPGPGRIIAFRVPDPGKAYVAARLRYLERSPILKEIAAGPGSTVCAAGGRIVIDGTDRGSVAIADRQGTPLPHWTGCRRLGPDEMFAFSNRIPNSFDSRYYGPVPAAYVVGVYLPVWTRGS
jgi:conjugative transfer signal peptidase TraF